MLVAMGANINAVNKKGFTPLHLAASKQTGNCVTALLRHETLQINRQVC
jgi:ankyrin repeat protein